MNTIKLKHTVLLSVFALSACFGGNDSNNNQNPVVDGGEKPTVPDEIQKLLFTSPSDKQTFIINTDVVIQLAPLLDKGYVELFINDLETIRLNAPYKHTWTADKLGKSAIKAKYFSDDNVLVSEGALELNILDSSSEVVKVTSNLNKIVDVEIGEILTLTAEAPFPLSKVDFIFNGESVKTFNSEPYTMNWEPSDFEEKNFTILAVPADPNSMVSVPEASMIRSFSAETIAYCDNKAQLWVQGQQYQANDYVKHKDNYFIAKQITEYEPSLEDTQLSRWSHISCENIAWLTKPSVNVIAMETKLNNGEKVEVNISIASPSDATTHITEVNVKRNNKIIKVLPNLEDQSYEHTFYARKVGFPDFPKDTITVSAKNNLNQKSETELVIFGNHAPTLKLHIKQEGYPENPYTSTNPFILSSLVQDIENKVDYVEYYINGQLNSRMDSSNNTQPLETEDIYMQLILTPGANEIRAVAVDMNNGRTEMTESIFVQ